MTWTYGGDPAVSTLAALRFLVGDTDTDDQLLADEEINYISGLYGDNNLTAASLCDKIAAKFAREVNTTNGDLRVEAKARYEHYKDLAKTYRKEGGKLATIWAGGRLLSEKETAAADTTITQPAFSIGMDDFPGSDVNTLSTQGW